MKHSVALLLAVVLVGCGMNEPVFDFTTGYQEVLDETAAAAAGDERHAEAFRAFMESLSVQSVRERTRAIYAPDAYLNDTLNEIRGAAAIEAHFAKSLEGVSAITVTFHDTVHSGNEWYFRWTMSTTFRSLRDGATVVTSGMSHVRFDEQGRVLLHRDFWDAASGVYEHVPVLGGAMRMIRSRMAAG